MTDNICLLAADCRQALFDAIKVDEGASMATRYEIGRAIQLIALMSDEIKALRQAALLAAPRAGEGVDRG